MKVQKFKSKWNLGFLAICEFVIISDRNTISQRLLIFFIWFGIHIQPFFNSTNGLNIWTVHFSSQRVDCSFKSTKKLIRDILVLPNKSKILGHCMFPMANLQKGSSLGFVPKSNSSNILILLYICTVNLKSALFSMESEYIFRFWSWQTFMVGFWGVILIEGTYFLLIASDTHHFCVASTHRIRAILYKSSQSVSGITNIGSAKALTHVSSGRLAGKSKNAFITDSAHPPLLITPWPVPGNSM